MSTQFLTLPTLMQVARRACGDDVLVRDVGLLGSALARPRSSVFGQDAYPTVHGKGAAFLHSLVSNYALVDGNKRLGWLGCVVFLWLNGWDVHAPEDEAFDLVMRVASGEAQDVEKIAEQLRGWSVTRV